MCHLHRKLALSLLAAILLFCGSLVHAALIKGIYITQSTLENTAYLSYLIERAKAVGIDTFVVDLNRPSKKYRTNIGLLKQNNITYVARIVIFPNGGTPAEVTSEAYWEKKYTLVQDAIAYGAEEIQLDYIRYNTKQPASHQNAKDIFKIIQWYKDRLIAQNIPLQVDVFGISSFGEAVNIGQNIKLFSKSVDTICPMVYPSHYARGFIGFQNPGAHPYEVVKYSIIYNYSWC